VSGITKRPAPQNMNVKLSRRGRLLDGQRERNHVGQNEQAKVPNAAAKISIGHAQQFVIQMHIIQAIGLTFLRRYISGRVWNMKDSDLGQCFRILSLD
jgi:hypothetical protein